MVGFMPVANEFGSDDGAARFAPDSHRRAKIPNGLKDVPSTDDYVRMLMPQEKPDHCI
jgi:hypothetical protein